MLRRHGKIVKLAPAELRLLRRIASAGGATVDRAALKLAVWGDASVSDNRLGRAVYALRRRLAADGGHPAIETMHGLGYRLSLPLEPAGHASGTTPEVPARGAGHAFDRLRRAHELLGRRTARNMRLALGVLEEAMARAPDCSEGRCLLANVHLMMALRGCGRTPSDHVARARAVVTNGRPSPVDHTGLRSVDLWLRAVADERAEAADECAWSVRHEELDDVDRAWRGFALGSHGRFDEALELVAPFGDMPGLAQLAISLCAYLRFCAGDAGGARAFLETALDELPIADGGWHVLSVVAAHQGDYAIAVRAAERACEWSDGLPLHVAVLAEALARQGKTASARQLLDGVRERSDPHVPPSFLAPAMLALGDPTAARACLERAVRERCVFRGIVRFDPRLQGALPSMIMFGRRPPPQRSSPPTNEIAEPGV
ncbi:MAG: winged helix-turn-helix domain-containing protein [Pseudomonadota bacterium]